MNFGSDEPTDSLDKLVYRNFLKQPPNLHLQCHLRIELGYLGNQLAYDGVLGQASG